MIQTISKYVLRQPIYAFQLYWADIIITESAVLRYPAKIMQDSAEAYPKMVVLAGTLNLGFAPETTILNAVSRAPAHNHHHRVVIFLV